jgi:DNA-binding winged helix-turn-helix (wHTH) protein
MIIRFGEFELDGSAFELRRRGRAIHVERRVFDLIRYLAANAHRVVPKAELLDEIWAGRQVTDGSLSVAMAAARRALGDDPMAQRVIRTRRGRGYQFVPPCDADGDAVGDPDRGAGGDADAARTAMHAGRPDRKPDGQPDEEDPSVSAFIGREREMNEFTRAASRLLQGQSTLLLVSGEPGIGKTRLLDEFFRLADPLGCTICIGRCAESGDAPALWPWYQVFRALRESRRQTRTRGAASDVASDVLPYVPPEFPPHDGGEQRDRQQLERIARELSPEHAPLESPLTSPEAARFQLYERMLDALTRLAANEKLVVALDDVHRADAATLGFLRFAARQTRESSILFVATHRVGELRSSPVHSRTLAELMREPHAVRLQIEGLNPLETTQLFEQLGLQRSSLGAPNQLHHHTGGNPFFIRQLSTLMGSNGATLTARALPPTLRDAILEQIAGLSSPARTLLEAAAVIGREFSVCTLADVVDVDGLRFDAAVDELLDSLVVRECGEPDRLLFAHILVRDAIFEQLGLSERRDLHGRIARSLSARHGKSSEAHAAETAYHLFEAQTPRSIAEARVFSEAAGEAASLRSAHDDAARHYARALDALRLTDASNDEERYRLLLTLGTEQCRSGNRSAAKETFADAALLARSLEATEKLARTALCVAPGFLAAEAGVSDPFLENLLTESLARVDPTNRALRAQLAARLAMTLHWSDAPARMYESIALAREISDRLDDPVTRLHVLVARWFCEWHHDRPDELSLPTRSRGMPSDSGTAR